MYFVSDQVGNCGGEAGQRGYIDNTDWLGNPSCCIHLGRPFPDPGSRGRRLPRPWACKRPPEMDTACEDYQPVCIVFISPPEIELCVLCMYFVCFVRVFCLFCVVRDYTVCTAPIRHHTRRKHMLAASVLIGET